MYWLVVWSGRWLCCYPGGQGPDRHEQHSWLQPAPWGQIPVHTHTHTHTHRYDLKLSWCVQVSWYRWHVCVSVCVCVFVLPEHNRCASLRDYPDKGPCFCSGWPGEEINSLAWASSLGYVDAISKVTSHAKKQKHFLTLWITCGNSLRKYTDIEGTS